MKPFFLALSILLLSEYNSSYAVTSLNTSDFKIRVFKDSSDTTGIENVKALIEDKSKLFIPADSLHTPLSINGTYWLYLEPPIQENDLEYVMKFHVFVSLIEVYPYPFTAISSYGGVNVPGRLKTLSGCNVLLKPGVRSYLVKVQNRVWSTGSVKSIEVLPVHAFYKEKEKHDLLQAFIQGFFWLMLIYNLSLFFLNKKKIHIYYIIYIFLNSLFFFFTFNYSEIYIFPGSYKLNHTLWAFQLIASFFYIMFMRMAFLKHCKAYTPFIDRWLILPYAFIRLFLNLVFGVTVFFRLDMFTIVSGLSNLIGTLVVIFIIFYFYKSADWFLRILLAGSFILILSGWASLLYVRYYLHSNNLFFEIGMLAELMLFTYALNKLHMEEGLKAERMKLQLQSELDNKNRELVFQAIQLSAKDEAISSIKDRINELGDLGKVDAVTISDSVLKGCMNQNLWKEFEVHFNETNPGFYASLTNKYPELSQNEIRLCAFLKLNLNTKEIAMITQRSSKSIEVMRSRIRQKMNLQRDNNLFLFLSQLQ